MTKRTIKVGYLARVEGEGSLYVETSGDQVKDVKLKIFEPPRFFEGFLKGRSYNEAPDITARICGICPVAYQMSTVHAIEDAFGVAVSDQVRRLRRLIYCGEWIESHMLHVMMLHAPDFLKTTDAMSLAKTHRKEVELGLAVKKLGNELIAVLGGREVHPINVKVGGFYKQPEPAKLRALRPRLDGAIADTKFLLNWVKSFPYPECSIDYDFVSLRHGQDYPFNEGRLFSQKNLDISVKEYEQHFTETHVEHSTALHSTRVGHGSYLTGPMARFNNCFDQLPSDLQSLATQLGLKEKVSNPYYSIQIRLVEVLFALMEARSVIEQYKQAEQDGPELKPRAGTGYAATEAPRGTLYHRFELDETGLISFAKIVPPTSQNQKRIEDDLWQVVTDQIQLPEAELTHLCEQTIRNYDPCISCSTHFLKMKRVHREGQ